MSSAVPEREPTIESAASAVPFDRSRLPSPIEKETFSAQERELKLQEQIQNLKGREIWQSRIFWIMLIWLLAVITMLVLQGFHVYGFHLSDPVLIAFISTTTVNVLAFGYIVVNYLFPKPKLKA